MPINRLNTPLLFDNRLQAKPVFPTVVDLARTWKPAPTQAGVRTVQIAPQSPVVPVRGTTNATVTLSRSWCLTSGVSVPQLAGLRDRRPASSHPSSLIDEGSVESAAAFQLRHSA